MKKHVNVPNEQIKKTFPAEYIEMAKAVFPRRESADNIYLTPVVIGKYNGLICTDRLYSDNPEFVTLGVRQADMGSIFYGQVEPYVMVNHAADIVVTKEVYGKLFQEDSNIGREYGEFNYQTNGKGEPELYEVDSKRTFVYKDGVYKERIRVKENNQYTFKEIEVSV